MTAEMRAAISGFGPDPGWGAVVWARAISERHGIRLRQIPGCAVSRIAGTGGNLTAMLRLFQVTDTLLQEGEDLLEQGKETVNQIVEAAKADPVLLAVLIGVGIITLAIFFWGMAKQVFKAAIVAGLLSAGVWYWYFNIH